MKCGAKLGNDILGEMRPPICRRLREARIKSGMTQKQAAWALGVTLGVVGQLESGYRMASTATLTSYATLYRTTVDALEGRA